MATNSLSETITVVAGIVAVAGVVITIVIAIFSTMNQSSTRYYEAVNACIQSQGTWVPAANNSGSCVINKQQGS